MVQRTPGRQLRKSQIWTLHPLKADVTLPSTTIWMLDAPPWHLTSDFGNFSFFQSFLCVCESFWKILILLKYLLSETVCTFSFISRPHPLPSFPLLRIPWFRLIQFCFSEITGPLFIVLSKLFKKWNLQVHIFFSLFMPFWSIIQWVSILSGLEISPQIPQNVQAQRRGGHVWCLILCLFRASRKWGTRKESLPSGTLLLKALEKQTSENNDKKPTEVHCTAAWAHKPGMGLVSSCSYSCQGPNSCSRCSTAFSAPLHLQGMTSLSWGRRQGSEPQTELLSHTAHTAQEREWSLEYYFTWDKHLPSCSFFLPAQVEALPMHGEQSSPRCLSICGSLGNQCTLLR